MHLRSLVLLGGVSALLNQGPTGATVPETTPQTTPVTVASGDYFQYPLPTWEPHCLGFGSQWRLCNGTVLRACPSGAVWLHTGVDIKTGIQPVMAAADGVIAGYIVDPLFRGGVLIRHSTAQGVVLTHYWHVWPRPGFRVGTAVTRGEVFADVADMGAQTHLHFAVFRGDYEANAWRGALPPSQCSGFPAFPYRFIEPDAFIQAHRPPVFVQIHTRQCRASLDGGL